MKKTFLRSLIVIGILSLALMASCDDGTADQGGQEKTVAAEYRGEFWTDIVGDGGYLHKIIVNEKDIIISNGSVTADFDMTSEYTQKYSAWTAPENDGTIGLWYGNEQFFGAFTNENTLTTPTSDGTYYRQEQP